jgi:hypothetical protein
MLGSRGHDPHALAKAIKLSSSAREFMGVFFYAESKNCRFLIDALPSHAFAVNAFLQADISHRFIAIPVQSFVGAGEKSHFFFMAANHSLALAASAHGDRLIYDQRLFPIIQAICASDKNPIAPTELVAEIPVNSIDANALPLWSAFIGLRGDDLHKNKTTDSASTELKKLISAAYAAVWGVIRIVLSLIGSIIVCIFLPFSRFRYRKSLDELETKNFFRFSSELSRSKFVNLASRLKSQNCEALIQKKLQQIAPLIPESSKNRTFAAAIAFTGRHELLTVICTLLLSYEEDQTLILVGSTDADEAFGNRLMEKHGSRVVFLRFPNNPLGAKWQFAAKAASLLDPQSLIILGSDDLLGPEFYHNAKKLIESNNNKAKLFGLDSWMLYDTSEDPQISGFPWRLRYRRDVYQITLGAGRLYTRALLNLTGWDLFQITWEKHLDGFGESQAHEYGADIEILPSANFPLLSIKANHEALNKSTNLLNSQHIEARSMDFTEALAFRNAFPDLHSNMDQLRGKPAMNYKLHKI